ncbi:MAG: DUF4157 domain-containing protein [Cyanobacteria bacterium P01_D01_bin.156]
MALAERTHRKKQTTPTHEGAVQSGRGGRVSALAMRSPLVQTKLTVNQPGDKYEQDADTVANAVMHSPVVSTQQDEGYGDPQLGYIDLQTMADEEESVQRMPSQDAPCPACEQDVLQRMEDEDAPIQRMEDEEQDVLQRMEDEQDTLQRTETEDDAVSLMADEDEEPVQRQGDQRTPSVSTRTAATIRSPGPGSPLPHGVRQRIEPHVGVNLSGVRVHNDTHAHRAAASLNARAFTHGSDIFLRRSESSHNLGLMAHESAHVAQQTGTGSHLSLVRENVVQAKEESSGEGSQENSGPIHPMRSRIVDVAKSKVGLVEAYTDSGETREIGGQTIHLRKGGDQLLSIIKATAPQYATTETQERDILNIRVLIGPGPDVDPSTPGVQSTPGSQRTPSWCGIFALWLQNQAGNNGGLWPGPWMGPTIGPEKLQFKTAGEQPLPGDVALQKGDRSHHGTVIDVKGSTIISIEGNTGPLSAILKRTRSKDQWLGFARAVPKAEDELGPEGWNDLELPEMAAGAGGTVSVDVEIEVTGEPPPNPDLSPRSTLEPSADQAAALSAGPEPTVTTSSTDESVPAADAAPEEQSTAIELLTPEPPASLSGSERGRLGQVRGRVGNTAAAESTLPAAESNVAGARAAVEEPQEEADARAEGEVVAAANQQEAPVPSIESICDRIAKIINEEEPDDEKELASFEADEAAQAGDAGLKNSVEGDAERIQGNYEQLDQPQEGIPEDNSQEIDVPPENVNAPDINADAAVPEPVELDLEGDVTASSERITEAGMDKPSARKAAEGAPDGPIATALDSQSELETSAQQDVPAVLEHQDQVLGGAATTMTGAENTGAKALNESRTSTIGGVLEQQTTMVTEEDRLRTEVSARAQEIVSNARQEVKDLLDPLPADALKKWEDGKKAVVNKFEEDLKKVTKWIDDNKDSLITGAITYLVGLPIWIPVHFRIAKTNFINGICKLLKDVSAYVDSVIDQCEKIIDEADKEHKKLFEDLPTSLQSWAETEQQKFSGQLEALRNQVDDAQANATRRLADAAVQAAVDARDHIKELRSQARGWIGQIEDALAEFAENAAKFIIEGLLTLVGIQPAAFWAVVDKIGQAIEDIADDPMNFADNLLSAIGQGFEQFFDRFAEHMLDGLLDWLFSGLGAVGVQIPTDLSLKSIITFFLQLMGISWAKIRRLLAKHIGEENVALIEKAYEVISTMVEMGPMGMVEMIQDKINLQDILDQVLEAAVEYMVEALIKAVSARIIILFNPVGAIAQAIEAIYRVLKWIFENAARIFSLIETVVNGITKIIAGDISGMADAVEGALAQLIVPVVDFLADYMGFGDLPEQIAKTIKGFQEWIEGLLDEAIGWIVEKGKALLKSLGIGGEEEDEDSDSDDEYDGQIGKVVNFSADGESHRLYIVEQAGDAVVMMASVEKPVAEHLNDYESMAQDLQDEEKKAEVLGLINQARQILSEVDTDADELAEDVTNPEIEPEEISTQDDAVESGEDRLVGIIRKIRENLGISNDIEYPFSVEGEGHILKAEANPNGSLNLLVASDTFRALLATIMEVGNGRANYYKQLEATDLEEQINTDFYNLVQDFIPIKNHYESIPPSRNRDLAIERDLEKIVQGLNNLLQKYNIRTLHDEQFEGFPPAHNPSYGDQDSYSRSSSAEVILSVRSRPFITGTNPQAEVAGISILDGYDKGHLIAASLGGSNTDTKNFAPMLKTTNRTKSPGIRTWEEPLYKNLIDERYSNYIVGPPPYMVRYSISCIYEGNTSQLQNWLNTNFTAVDPNAAENLFRLAKNNTDLTIQAVETAMNSSVGERVSDVTQQLGFLFLPRRFSVNVYPLNSPDNRLIPIPASTGLPNR